MELGSTALQADFLPAETPGNTSITIYRIPMWKAWKLAEKTVYN